MLADRRVVVSFLPAFLALSFYLPDSSYNPLLNLIRVYDPRARQRIGVSQSLCEKWP